MISNCGSDENRGYSGGRAGDQTGGEWALINWYNRPWNCVIRHPDPKVRAMIAQMAIAAAKNNNIGYDQGQRTTFWQHLVTSNYDPAQITIPCEADCSSGVAAICKAVGYRLGIQKLKDISIYVYTRIQRDALRAAGFQILTDSKYLTSDRYLLEGDILLNDIAHTAINVTTGPNASSVSSPVNTPTTSSVSSSVMKNVQIWVNNYCNARLVIDGEFGPKTKKGLCMALQKTLNDSFGAKLTVDGDFGPATKGACVSASRNKNLTYIAQAMLYTKGYNMSHSISNNNLDGIYGSGMKTTVKQFQTARGLSQDGDCGPATFYSLFN